MGGASLGLIVGVGQTVTHDCVGTWALAELLPDSAVMHSCSRGIDGVLAGHAHCLSKVIQIVSKCHVPVPTLARQNEVTNIAPARVFIPGKVPVVACLSGRYFKINK